MGCKMKGNKKIFNYTKKCDVKWKEMKRYLSIWKDWKLNERKLKDI